MSENTEDTEPAAEDAQAVTDTPDAEETEADTTEATDAEGGEDITNAEAAKWRRKLREAEKDRDSLAEKVAALQRHQVENLLSRTNVKPDALFAVAELAELLTEEGTVDADRVDKAVTAAREKFGITKPSKGNLIPGVGNQPNMLPNPDAWQEAFKPSRRR